MKAKSKIIVSAVLAIVLCVSLIAGTTFALFTSESSVNIAVTAGKVDVVANVKSINGVAVDEDGVASATLASGGVASVNGNEVVVSNIVPMDEVTLVVGVVNNSTVNAKYRTSVSCVSDEGLFGALSISDVDGLWREIAPKAAIDDITVTISFPEAADNNDYQGKTCKLAVVVEAIQGNAQTQNNVLAAYNFTDASQADEFCPLCDDGKTHEGPHTPNLVVENGQAKFEKEGAWLYCDKLDWENNYYQIIYDVDLTDLADGKYIAFDQGECETWQDLHLGIVNEGGKYIAYKGLQAKTDKTVVYGEVAQQVTVTATFFKVGEKLHMTLNLSGLGDVLTNSGALANKICWDVYKVSEGAKAAIDNFALIERTGVFVDA